MKLSNTAPIVVNGMVASMETCNSAGRLIMMSMMPVKTHTIAMTITAHATPPLAFVAIMGGTLANMR